MSRRLLIIAFFIFSAGFLLGVAADPVNIAMQAAVKNAAANAASQQRINQLEDETRQMFAEYQGILEKNRQLEEYLTQLRVLLDDQSQEIARREKEIAAAKGFERQVLPLLNRMIAGLARMIENDVPFLSEERSTRVSRIRKMMRAADISTVEKFRRVFEAYQIENDYGRSMEAYRGSISIASGEDKVVDFLRIGRNILLYQTLDGQQNGMWDAQERQWQVLDKRHRQAVRDAILMARKQAPPDLLILPVRAAPLSGESL